MQKIESDHEQDPRLRTTSHSLHPVIQQRKTVRNKEINVLTMEEKGKGKDAMVGEILSLPLCTLSDCADHKTPFANINMEINSDDEKNLTKQ
ncbi:hypothetical protein TNCT_347201 [Trichonephila clavata]|uniref:Uncharacterized protein n=1 Tax=Trichonephila clavata TaxID=2740835 RepID=A0A8X6G5C9_TRICU|nr:hypothetical protein TNCT_347201 [Trichonephila clavata]